MRREPSIVKELREGMAVTVANFDDTLAYIDSIQKARTPDEICRTLIDVTSRFGMTALLAGTVPKPGSPRDELRSHVMLCDWPSGWLERYIAMNHIEHDPLVAFMKRNLSAVYWHDAIERAGADRAARRVCAEASAFRLNDGFAVPVVTVEGEVVIVSFGGEEIDLSQQTVGVVSLVSTFAIGRAMQLSAAREAVEMALGRARQVGMGDLADPRHFRAYVGKTSAQRQEQAARGQPRPGRGGGHPAGLYQLGPRPWS